MKTALELSKQIFIWAKSALPSECELEVYLSEGRGRSILWSEKKCEECSQAEGGGAGLRVIRRDQLGVGQQGYAFTTSFEKGNIEKSAKRAYESSAMLPGDPFRKLPSAKNGSLNLLSQSQELFDATTFSEGVRAIIERLRAGESALLKKYPYIKSILRAGFSEGISESAIINSSGIETSFAGTHTGLGVSCLAEKNGERQEGGFGQTKRYRGDLDWETTFKTSAERTLALLGGKPIPTGKIPVLFDPSVGSEFLSLISGAVCADSIQKGKSFLAGKIGSLVSSNLITMIDDGTLKRGIATAPVDDEGVPTQKTVVIEKGALKHVLYDTYTALKDGASSTGNASRAGFKSSPSSGSSNFYIEAGATPREKLLSCTKGLYLYDVMGLHMADPISGDFSVGAIGSWCENGEFQYGVRGVTLAGNLLDFLKNVDAVCQDLTFFGSVGCPTFRVAELTVSGS